MYGFSRVTLRRLGVALVLLLIVMTFGLAAPAVALVTAGGLDTPDLAIDIELVEGVAYIADYPSASTNQGGSLRIVDVSDPEHPVELGSSASPVGPRALQVAVGLVFVADGDAGLRILDASNPAAPSDLSLLSLPGFAYGVELAGERAYVSSGPLTGGTDGGLHVVDVTNPMQPTLMGSLTLPGEIARDAAAVGGLAYVVTSSTSQVAGSLHIVDVSDPAQPITVASLALPYRASDVAISGGLAYVANGTSGLTIVDVSNSATPFVRGVLGTHAYSRGVTVAGSLVYLTEVGLGSANTSVQHATLRLVDVSDPANPVEIGGLAMPETLAPDFLDGAFQAEIEGRHAYVANGRAGLQIVDLANPAYPATVASIGTARSWEIDFSSGRAYVADALYGVHIFEAANPAAPAYRPTYLADGSDWVSRDVVAEGQLAYVAAGQYTSSGQRLWEGIRVVNVANASSPADVGSVELEEPARDIALVGDLLVVAATSGLSLIDVGTPAAPIAVGALGIPGGALAVSAHGTSAFVAAGSGGRKVIDISQPEAPGEIAALTGQGARVAPAVSRDLQLIAAIDHPAGARVRVIDVSDPSHPSEIGSWRPRGMGVLDLTLAGGLAYVISNGVISVVDVMDPSSPRELGSPLVSDFWANHAWQTVAIQDGVIWAGTQSQGLNVIELGPHYASLGDLDEDGLRGREDNCSETPNPDQADVSRDGYGDACDADYDDDA